MDTLIQMLIQTLGEVSYSFLSYLTQLSSRLCLIYLIPAWGLIYLSARQRSLGNSAQPATAHTVLTSLQSRWWSRSARQDYGLIILNATLKVLFFSHLTVLGLDLAVQIAESLTSRFGAPQLGFSLPVIAGI